jgi:hypothetical protein
MQKIKRVTKKALKYEIMEKHRRPQLYFDTIGKIYTCDLDWFNVCQIEGES